MLAYRRDGGSSNSMASEIPTDRVQCVLLELKTYHGLGQSRRTEYRSLAVLNNNENDGSCLWEIV